MDKRKHMDALIEEHVERMPQATQNKIIWEARKELVGEFFLRNDNDPHHLLSLEELKPVFNRCKELNSPHLRCKVITFKYLRRLGVMDGIAKLGGVKTWAYVQWNQFPSHDDETDKVRKLEYVSVERKRRAEIWDFFNNFL